MPLTAVGPLFSAVPSPCSNFLAGPIVIAVFGFGIVMSLALVAVGIAGIVLTAVQARGGLTVAVLTNVIVATLYLLLPAGFAPGEFANPNEVITDGAFYSALAVPPIAGAMVLLAPSLYRSTRTYVLTLAVAGILLLPGALGVTIFGLTVAGVALPAAEHSAASNRVHC